MTDQTNLQNGIVATRLGGGNDNTIQYQQLGGIVSPLPQLPFHPTNQAQDFALNLLRSQQGDGPLDAYNIYRKVYIESQGANIPTTELSSTIKAAWSHETSKVKEFYLTVEKYVNTLKERQTFQSPFDHMRSPIDLRPTSSSTVPEETQDFYLFPTDNSQSIGPPTPMSITNSPINHSDSVNSFNHSDSVNSENNADGQLFFPELSQIEFSANNFSLF